MSSRRDFSAMISELESLDRRRRYDDITSQFAHGIHAKQAAIISQSLSKAADGKTYISTQS